jgi:ABC-type Fe3+/spermidine/putrescine transport system ATPase subunit
MRLRGGAVSAAPPAIELRGVTKRYGTHQALSPVDIQIAEGEFFCLLGPSGCGKTTTLNLIGGFVGATTGAILIRGKPVERLPPHRRPVNTVFQSYALFPHMTVRDNVAFGLKMARVAKGEAGTRVEEALSLVGLDQQGDRLPGQLSGGQQQRVAVARALVNRPAVLLLDEPLGALDLKLRKRLQVELSQIHREIGTTFVYVTHDQEEAMSMATRIAVMNEGRVEQIGEPSEIYYRPTSRFVADFIGESNFIGGSSNGSVLMVRPESIRISMEPRDGGLRGRVLQTSFLGNQTRVAVSCDGMEAPVLASLFGREQVDTRNLNPDQEVTLWWEPDDAVQLPVTHSRQEGDT